MLKERILKSIKENQECLNALCLLDCFENELTIETIRRLEILIPKYRELIKNE